MVSDVETTAVASRASLVPRAIDAYTRVFLDEKATIGARVFRALLALWTVAFFVPRLPHATELYARPVLRQSSRVWRALGDPIPPPWLATTAIVLVIVLSLVFAFTPRHARVVHVLLLVPLSFLFAVDTVMPRAYGGLAYLQWWLLFLAPYERAFDDDGALSRAPPVGTRVLQAQLALVYFFAVFSKLVDGEGWLDGRAVFHAFYSERYGRFLLSTWGIPGLLAVILSWGTILGEFFVAVALVVPRAPRVRALGLLTLVGLHVGMALTLRVSVLFHALMIAHCALFFSDAAWSRILRTDRVVRALSLFGVRARLDEGAAP